MAPGGVINTNYSIRAIAYNCVQLCYQPYKSCLLLPSLTELEKLIQEQQDPSRWPSLINRLTNDVSSYFLFASSPRHLTTEQWKCWIMRHSLPRILPADSHTKFWWSTITREWHGAVSSSVALEALLVEFTIAPRYYNMSSFCLPFDTCELCWHFLHILLGCDYLTGLIRHAFMLMMAQFAHAYKY